MEIYYEVIGEGYPLVCLHGNGEDHHIFDQCITKLKNRYQLILIDSRYHGKSLSSGELSYRQMKDDVLGVLSQLHIKEYDLMGFSDGAIVGLMIGMEDERLKHLICIGANTSPQMIKPMYRYTFYLQYFCLKIIGLYHKKAKHFALLYRLMCHEPHLLDEDLSRVTIPTLVLAGEYDMIKQEDTMHLGEVLPYSVVKIITGGNHFLLRDSFQQTFHEIELFLKACHEVVL